MMTMMMTMVCLRLSSLDSLRLISVCVFPDGQRAKFPSSRPADHLILERQKQDAARDKVREFTRYQQTWDIKNSWLQSSERHHLRGTIQRQVQATVRQYESNIQDRRVRLVCGHVFVQANSFFLNQRLCSENTLNSHQTVCDVRLRTLLEEEEQQLLQELEEAKETTVERQAKMREKAKALRMRRESERQQLVSDKQEQLFR